MDFLDFLKKNIDQLLGLSPKTNGIQAPPKPPTQKKKPSDALIDLEDDEGDPPLINWGVNNAAASSKNSANQIPLNEQVEMVLDALNNVLLHNAGIEFLLIGQFEMLFKYLRLNHLPKVQLKTLAVISKAANNKECVTDISHSFQLPLLLMLLVKPKECKHIAPNSPVLNVLAVETILRTLIALTSNREVVRSLLDFGGLLYVLQILCADRSEQPEVLRLLAAELLAKLQADQLTGPRWTRFIIRYLPPIFADSLRDSPASAIQMFDSNTENPELIWNDSIRQKVKQLVGQQLQELLVAQSRDVSAKWSVNINANQSEEPTAYSTAIENELIVGGVFIRLFNQNPGWNVRHPKQFATELMEAVLELMQRPNKNLEPITTALVSLIANHPGTADQVRNLKSRFLDPPVLVYARINLCN